MSSTIDSNPREAIQLSKFGLGAIAFGFLLAFVLPLTGDGESFIGFQEKKLLVITTLIKGLIYPDTLLGPLIGCLLMAAGFFMIARKSYGARVACYTAFIGALLPAILFFMICYGAKDHDGFAFEIMHDLVKDSEGVSMLVIILAIFPISFLMMAIGLLRVGRRTVLKTNRYSALGMQIMAVAFVTTVVGIGIYFNSKGQDGSVFEFGQIATWIGIVLTLGGIVLSMFKDGVEYSALEAAPAPIPPTPPMMRNRPSVTPQTPSNDGYVSWRKPDSDVTVSHDELRRSESDDRTSESLFVILRNPLLHTRTELENAAMALYNRRDPLYLSAFRTMDRDALRAIADNPSAHLRAEVFIAGDILAGRL